MGSLVAVTVAFLVGLGRPPTGVVAVSGAERQGVPTATRKVARRYVIVDAPYSVTVLGRYTAWLASGQTAEDSEERPPTRAARLSSPDNCMPQAATSV